MTCEEALNLICARLDRELAAEDAARLEAHLADCIACRATVDAMAAQDADLRQAFAGRRAAAQRVADSVVAQLPLDLSERAVRRVRGAHRIPWLPMILSAA